MAEQPIKPIPEEFPPYFQDNEPRAVYVDTTLNTHIAVSITPYSTVLQLQQLICLEHFNCFPKYGRILTRGLKVKINNRYYHLPETMLLKSAFHGFENAWSPWVVTAEVWMPGTSLKVQRHNEVKHLPYVKPSTQHDQNHQLEHTKLSTQHDHNHKLEHKKASTQHDHDHKLEHIKPSSQHDHDHKLEHIKPSIHGISSPSSEPHEVPDTSSKLKRKRMKKKKDKGVDKVDSNLQPTVKSNENTENKNDVLKTGSSQDRSTAQQKEYPPSDVKEQLNSRNKPPARPCVVHNLPAFVQGTSTHIAENLNKKSGTPDFASSPGSKAKKSKKKKISDVAMTNNGCAFPEKGDAPSDNGNPINRNEPKVIAATADVSRSQLKNVPESMPQQVQSNFEKNIEENHSLMKPDNNPKKMKPSESKHESQNAAQKVLLSHLNSISEPLAEGESLNLDEKVKEIEEAVAPSELETTGKKKKSKKAKSSSTTQDLSSRMPNDSEKTDGTRNIHVELSRPNVIGQSDKDVETASVKLKSHLGSSVKQQLDEENKEMASPISAIQSDKPKKKRQKKQPVPAENLSSIHRIQHSDETMMKMNAPNNIDDSLMESTSIDDVPNQNAVTQGKEQDDSSPALGLEDSAVLDDVTQNEKGQASKQKVKKVDQSSSVDTATNNHHLVGSKNNREIAKTENQKSITDQKQNDDIPPLSARQSTVSKKVKDTLVPSVDPINTSKNTGVSSASSDDSSQSSEDVSMSGGSSAQKICKENKAKGQTNKLEEDGPGLERSSRLILKEKKGCLASSRAIFDDENSSSSDEEYTDSSNSSTTLPPDDDSENESKGVVDSKHDSPKHNGSSKVNSSAFKLESILRSSSRYKKAKLTASESQDQDEPPEFVPDSLADM